MEFQSYFGQVVYLFEPLIRVGDYFFNHIMPSSSRETAAASHLDKNSLEMAVERGRGSNSHEERRFGVVCGRALRGRK